MKKLLSILISLLTLGSCSSTRSTSPQAAHKMVKNNEAVLIDVREENEVKEGMLEDALWFPLSKLENDKHWKEEFEKMTAGKTIFLHCRSGVRSGKMLRELKKVGIDSENLGGYEDLKKVLSSK